MKPIPEKDRIASILFSDVKGFSKIQNDALKKRLYEIIQEDIRQLLNEDNHFYRNSWGDAFFICGDSPTRLAEVALQLRDKSRNRNWEGIGFPHELAVRIGLHIQQVKVLFNDDGTVRDAVGVGVDTAARIEPVTEPDKVFCSSLFYEHLLNDPTHRIKGNSVGRKQLAKNYKEMELYELLWQAETPSEVMATSVPSESKIPLPNIKGGFTDKQKTDYLYQAFEILKSYFHVALEQLEASNSSVETAFRETDKVTFIGEIYLQGAIKNKCKIWIGSSFALSGIHYAAGRNIDSSSGWNELIRVESDKSSLYLRFTMGDHFGGSATDAVTHNSTPEQIAEALWRRFIRVIEK